VVVVRTMTLAWASLARVAGSADVLLNGANSWVWRQPIDASSVASAVWTGDLVLPAGEIIRASTSATGTVFLTVSGFQLAAL
jgi:hypothetical protein